MALSPVLSWLHFPDTVTYFAQLKGSIASASRSKFGLETTGRATLLAAAMTAVPERHVEAVLAAHWSTWTNWRTPDAALATALGLRLPPGPPTPSTAPPAAAGSGQVIQVSGPPPSPVCH